MNCRRTETLMESPPPKDKFQRLARSLVPALVFVPGACLACWSILFVEGWPQNHEFLSSFERAEAFRQAFKEEDFFPLWSPLGFYGYGSPLPFFYHRLHSTFVALLSFVTGSVYWALRLSIPIFLVVGALGIERLARYLAISSPFRLAAGVLLLFSSYTLTDWLIRGAMAEFTALMLLPWLFYYGLLVIRESRGRTGLGITLVLLFCSHSVIFFYSMFFLMFLAFSWALDQRSDSKGTMVGLLRLFFVPLVLVLTLCGPYALSVVLLATWFNIRSLQEGYYVPARQFRPFLRYLYDINFANLPAVAYLMTLLSLNLSGVVLAEVARIWLFMLPFPVLYTAQSVHALLEKHRTNEALYILALQYMFILVYRLRLTMITLPAMLH